MLCGERIQFPSERVVGGRATRWKHSSGSHYLSFYTETFVFSILMQKLDAHPSLPLGNPVNWQFLLSWACVFNKGAVRRAWNPILTLDIEGSVGGVADLSRDRVLCDALKVPRVQLPIHGSELEVAALLEAPLAVFQPLAVVQPPVSDVGWIADLAPQHGAAAVQSVLGFGLLGELDGGGLNDQNWSKREKRKRIRTSLLLTFYCFFHSLSGGMWCLD